MRDELLTKVKMAHAQDSFMDRFSDESIAVWVQVPIGFAKIFNLLVAAGFPVLSIMSGFRTVMYFSRVLCTDGFADRFFIMKAIVRIFY
jgi:hypothetical protein